MFGCFCMSMKGEVVFDKGVCISKVKFDKGVWISNLTTILYSNTCWSFVGISKY